MDIKQGDQDLKAKTFWVDSTHTACIGDLPGLLSLSLLLVCSMAPFSSSRIALAKLPRVGFPMEAVVYRGMLFSAIEACINQNNICEDEGYTEREREAINYGCIQ